MNRDELDDLFPLWRTLAFTGMRRSEALALRWSDINFTTGRETPTLQLRSRQRDRRPAALSEQVSKQGRRTQCASYGVRHYDGIPRIAEAHANPKSAPTAFCLRGSDPGIAVRGCLTGCHVSGSAETQAQ